MSTTSSNITLAAIIDQQVKFDRERRQLIDMLQQAIDDLNGTKAPARFPQSAFVRKPANPEYRGTDWMLTEAEIAASKPRKGKGGRPKGYVMSAATKAKLRAAWKRRKAAAFVPVVPAEMKRKGRK